MSTLRNFFRDHRRFAALLVALTLMMKALVPAGFMVDGDAKVITVHICADTLGAGSSRQITLPQSGHDDGHRAHADSSCHFTALGHAVTGGADPIQLTLALAFILGLGFAPLVRGNLRRIFHLRPPLRGPPTFT